MEDKEKELEKKDTNSETKKSNKLLVILFGLLFLVACYGAGYFVGTSVGEQENKEQEKKEEKEGTDKEETDGKEDTTTEDGEEEVELEKLDVNSAVVKKLFEVFREDNYEKKDVWDANSEYTDFEKKMYIAYLSINESEFVSKKCGDLGATYAFDKDGSIYYCGTNFSDKAGMYYGKQDWENFGKELVNNQVSTISSAKLRTAYERIYGINSSYKDENLSLHFDHFLYYDKSSDSYTKFSCECGGEMGPMNQTISNVVQNGTGLTIETTMTNPENETTKINYNFEYEKETGNYIFVSREEK